MKISVISIGLVVFFLQSAIASGIDVDSKSMLDSIVKIADENSKAPRKSFVFRYNARNFDLEREVLQLEKDYNSKSQNDPKAACRYRVVPGSRINTEILKGDTSSHNYTQLMAAQLEQLDDQAMLISIISALWDGKSGDSRTCSEYEFNVYTLDGYKLTLYFN